MLSRLLFFHDLSKCCQYLLLFQGLSCRAGELFSGTVELSQIALSQGVICLHTSREMGLQVRPVEAVHKPLGTPGGVQWMRASEWSVDPLSVPLSQSRIYGH